MLLFRSEEHLERWLIGGRPRGATLTLDQQWRLARAWFEGRDRPEWRRRSPSEAEAIFRSVGLSGPFWTFPDTASE